MIDRMRNLRLADLRHTTAFRLTAGLCAVFVVAVIGLLGLTYTLTAQQLFLRTYQILAHRIEPILRAPPGAEVRAANEAIAAVTSGLEFIVLYDAHGHRLTGNLTLAAPFPLGRYF